jgi:hypothetical protein
MDDHRNHDASRDSRKAAFVEEISKYIEARNCNEAFTRQQLGQLNGLERLQAQRQSILDNIAHYYAKNPKADVASGLLTVITFYADNNDGACELSNARLAAFLSRSPRAIQDALARLVAAQVVIVEPRINDTNLMTPWVHRSFGVIRDPLTWILDIRAPVPKTGRIGRPPSPELEIPPQSSSPLFREIGEKWSAQ